MKTPDFIILLIYFAGLLLLGWVLGKRIKNSKDMFIAGKNSSWWIAGLSTYMTIFSAGTFVVWGGVAYRSGMVAVTVAMTLGLTSLFVGKYLAGKWANLGIESPAEYLGIRFGKSIVQFFSVIGIVGRGVHMAVALYAIAIMAVALVPLPEGHLLADPKTGHLSISYVIMFLGAITFVYTAMGGFLAAVMTDVVQFAVLIAMVIIMVPLSLQVVGGADGFVAQAPDNFFQFVDENYSWSWMVLWFFLNISMIGGDWAFVQRYISVPSINDAKKSAYLVAILYFLTPILWYTPAMAYRIVNPDANPEQAYMLMSQHLLGVGMIGLMLAAMISATLSTVSSNLNVFANVFAYDIYRAARPKVSDASLMTVGRVFTYTYGLAITFMAITIPYLGGAEKVVIPILTMVISPLFIPSIWGLFSKKINISSVWISLLVTFSLGFLIKSGLILQSLVKNNEALVDAYIGFVVPVAILLIIEFIKRKQEVDSGWVRYQNILGSGSPPQTPTAELKAGAVAGTPGFTYQEKAEELYSTLAIRILTGTFMTIGFAMIVLSLTGTNQNIWMMNYGLIFFIGASLILAKSLYKKR